jgi:hypothetical protein
MLVYYSLIIIFYFKIAYSNVYFNKHMCSKQKKIKICVISCLSKQIDFFFELFWKMDYGKRT